ncbi:MAG: cytochrome c [Bacteroidia bacterium]|nr:cytochrome c [Bacteroidia bacterium]
MLKFGSVILLVTYLVLGISFINPLAPVPSKTWNDQTPVSEVLKELGDKAPMHALPNMDEAMVKRGEGLVLRGKTTAPDGKQTKIQSKYFLCTDCHNIRRENPDLRKSDPEARLPFVIEKGIPFLQGSTFFGIVNRESWYNDDYYYKYGQLVEKARNDLRESIQLCSTVCSQGRALETWEIDAIVAYFWSLEVRLGDLDMTADDRKKLSEASGSDNKAELLKWFKTYYALKSPAHFGESPHSKTEGYEGTQKGNPEKGKLVFQASCMTCHAADGPAKYLTLDTDRYSRGMFKRNITHKGQFSIYEIVRHGTHPIMGHDPYMPHYPLERMSNQQVEDLRAWFEEG